MSKTWVEKRGWERIRERMTKGFKWEVQMTSRKNKKGRAIGGIAIGVRAGIEVIEEKDGKAIEGIMRKVVKIGEERWRIVGVYANGDVKEKWEGIKEWVEDKTAGIRIVVGGDFNARTGEQEGRWEGELEEEEVEGRRSKDRKVNREGRYLLEVLEEAGWFIFNEGGKGKWTYSGARGKSVLDYVVGDEDVWERVYRIKVEDRMESDHFPVVVWVKGEERILRGNGGKEVKWVWWQEGKRCFREKLERMWEGRREEWRVGWEGLREDIRGY